MNRVVTVFLAAALVLGAVATAFADSAYDGDASRAVMRANAQAMRGLRTAIGTDDFLAATGHFAGLAQGSRTLLEMDPPRGSEDEWERINNALVDAALEGVAAASARDKAGVGAAQAKIGALNKDGHAAFK